MGGKPFSSFLEGDGKAAVIGGADKVAYLRTGKNQPFLLQLFQTFSDGLPAGRVLAAQLTFGGEQITRAVLTCEYFAPDFLVYCFIHTVGFLIHGRSLPT